MIRCLIGSTIVLLIFLEGTASLNAAIITTLYSTGMSDTGTPLPDLSVDPHYKLISVPNGSGMGPDSFVVDSTKFPLQNAWMPNDSSSKWIAPQADQSTFSNDTGSGVYVYRTTFDLTGLVSSTAKITGKWTTDNFGDDILLNGTSLGIQHISEPPNTFSYFSTFNISSGFVPGVNTLDFVVDNPPLGYGGSGLFNPTGLRVELTGTATAVPEPGSSVIWLAGTVGVGLVTLLRRRFA